METNLTEVLRKCARPVDANGNFTHVTYFDPRGKWEVRPDQLTAFWENYCELAQQEGCFGIAEKVEAVMPIVAKLRINFQNTAQTDNLYGDNFLMEVVYCYQIAIQEVLRVDMDVDRDRLICVILKPETTWFYDNEITLDLRFQFPYCQTDPVSARAVRGFAISNLLRRNVMAKLAETPTGSWENIISASSSQENLALYGSVEHKDQPALKFYQIVDLMSEEDLDTGDIPDLDLKDVFDYQQHRDFQRELVNQDFLDEFSEEPEFLLPMFLSIGYCSKVTLPKDDKQLAKPMRLANPQANPTEDDEDEEIVEEEPKDMAERFLGMLGASRYNEKHYWLEIGRALFGIHEGEAPGLRSWIRFTEKSAKFTAEECRNYYPTFVNSNRSVRTLAWYAREDSPEIYKEWHVQWYGPYLNRATEKVDDDIADAVYRYFWLDHACTPSGKSGWEWWYFAKNRWIRQHDAHILVKAIKTDFNKLLREMRIKANIRALNEKRPRQQKIADALDKDLAALIKKLGTRLTKINIIKSVYSEFHLPALATHSDLNDRLMGTPNCVLEVLDEGIIARPGKPEDLITMATNVPYLNMNWGHPQVKAVAKWIRQIFPNDAKRHLFNRQCASWLQGRNREKKFFFWSGKRGNNCKSTFLKLIRAALGAYVIDLDVTELTEKKRGGGGPSPQTARIHGTRAVFLTEPDPNSTILSGFFKKATGGDSFFTRFLHDNGKDIENLAKITMLCNDPIAIEGAGDAEKYRTAILEFNSYWSFDAPATEEEQWAKCHFPIDLDFESRLPSLAPAFLWIMVQNFPVYVEEGLEFPEEVLQANQEYWRNNDLYSQFVDEEIERIKTSNGDFDRNHTLTFRQIFPRFKIWYTENITERHPNGKEVRRELTRVLGSQLGSRWIGITLKESEAIPVG